MSKVMKHSARHSHSGGAEESTSNRPILAERFKTKMCRNYLTTGHCPYEVRCMFAHGEHEMRTPEMNLADGLITEEAIKATQRVHMMQLRRQRMEHAASFALAMQPIATYQHNPYAAVVLKRDWYAGWDMPMGYDACCASPEETSGTKMLCEYAMEP